MHKIYNNFHLASGPHARSMEVVSQDPLDSSFHYMDNHLCIVAFGPNVQKNLGWNTCPTPPPPSHHSSFPQRCILGSYGPPSYICT